MSPRPDKYGQDNHYAPEDEYEEDPHSITNDDDDEVLKEDMTALAQSCMIDAPKEDPLLAAGDTDSDSDDEWSDHECVKRVQSLCKSSTRFPQTDSDSSDEGSDMECLKRVQSLYNPSTLTTSTMITVSDSDDSADDFEDAHAILKRFSNYNEGNLEDRTKTLTKGDKASSLGYETDIASSSLSSKSDVGAESCPVLQDPDTTNLVTDDIEMQHGDFVDSYEPDAGVESCTVPQNPNTTNLVTGDIKMQYDDFFDSYEPDVGAESCPIPQNPYTTNLVTGDTEVQLGEFFDIYESDVGAESCPVPQNPYTTNLVTDDTEMQLGDFFYSYEPDAGAESCPVPQNPDTTNLVTSDIKMQHDDYVDSYEPDAVAESCPVTQNPDTTNLVTSEIKMQHDDFVDSYEPDAGAESCPVPQHPDTTNLVTGDIKMQHDDFVDSYEPDVVAESCPVTQNPDTTNLVTGDTERQLGNLIDSHEPDAGESSSLPQKRSRLPPAVSSLVDAINQNRALQKFHRSKLIGLEAKIEENKQIRNKVKVLKDFQITCSRRTGRALSLKKDPRVQLISARKSPAPDNTKGKNKKESPMCYGPPENSRVANYKMVLERFPVSIDRKKWSDVERENLSKGIKQQFQEMLLQISVNRASLECSSGDANHMDNIIASVKDIEITPERIREFLPKVNWDRLASMYLPGRAGAECQSRWLNCEDPLINQGPWTSEEDKSLMIVVQEKGIRNWFDIAVSLGTNRTPFQCLARYQRSLNPSMLNSEWTEEEDAQLRDAVAHFGENNWQSVASVLERRTGAQCSNRWRKSLCPVRKGTFTLEEDKRLTVAVRLFGQKWNQIAKYVPGRSQSQCRDRYLNSLDPSLKWGGWTEEEDSRLAAAIIKHGFCWTKVAEDLPPRTDSQCRKRWKVLHPDQFLVVQQARKKQKCHIASNFVDRESERPNFTPNDFLPIEMLASSSNADAASLQRKQKKKSSNVPKKRRSNKHAAKARIAPKEVKEVACNDKVKISIESSESQDWDMTLASFLHKKSKKGRSKSIKINDASKGQGGKPEDGDAVKNSDDENNLTSDDDDDMTIACRMRNKLKKSGQAAKGISAGSSSKPSGSSMPQPVKEETVCARNVVIKKKPPIWRVYSRRAKM